MKLELALLFAAGAYAQAPANFEASVHAAMASSLAQQRASIRKQAAAAAKTAATPGGTSFFTEAPPIGLGLLAECDPLPTEQLNAIITGAAQKVGVSFELIRAVLEEESAARPCAISFRGAQGLMQLMPATAEQFDLQDPFDPKQNVEAGAKMLKRLLEKYDNNLTLALSAYNAGSGRVDQEGGIPPIPETLNYVADILRKLRPTEDKPAGSAPSVAAPEQEDQ
jgi:soluble lytic murein transglycosylase-like protein